MSDFNLNLSTKDLFDSEYINKRTLHICENELLLNVGSIFNYYLKYGNFIRIRGCGKKSNKELTEVSWRYEKLLSIHSNQNEKKKDVNQISLFREDNIMNIIEELSSSQKISINYQVRSYLTKLSNRSKNVIGVNDNYLFDFMDYLDLVTDKHFDYKKLEKVGVKSENELKLLFIYVRERIIENFKLKSVSEQLTQQLNSFLIWKFKIEPSFVDNIWKDYEIESGIPIFKTIDLLIRDNFLFKDNGNFIFKKGFNIWENNEFISNDEISKQLNLTSERVRQIRNEILNDLNSIFSFVDEFEELDYSIYGVDTELDNITLENQMVRDINRSESTRFNIHFVTFIISILVSKSHKILGNLESVFFDLDKDYQWKHIYLIRKEFLEDNGIQKVVIDIFNRINERNENDYKVSVKQLLEKYQVVNNSMNEERVIEIVKTILNSELGLFVDNNYQIIIERNTIKQISEYVIDVLNQFEKPLLLYTIYDILKSKYPDKFNSIESLRSSCLRDDRIISFGKNSIYGLKVWENEMIKGGTVHDLTEEFLNNFDTPIDIKDIYNYVKPLRPNITEIQLYGNLKSRDGTRFVFYKNKFVNKKTNFIGLINKNYENKYIVSSTVVKRRSWEKSYLSLKYFIKVMNRFPMSDGNDEEQKLYRFLNVQINKMDKGKLPELKSNRIQNLINDMNFKRRKRHNN